MKNFKFPKRFEIEGLNPLDLKVKVVSSMSDVKIFNNLQEASEKTDLNKFHSPMADKINNEWCVRFETPEVYQQLSA